MSASEAMPARAGEYQLVEKLGAGGMGEVYLGVSPTADRVAVKLVKAQLVGDSIRQRFADEVEHLKTVFGTRVARFEGAGLADDPAWLATEYVPGLTLKQYVDQHGPLPAELAAMVGAMLADGLAKVHEAGLLHRDLKPHNVIMGPDGPKLIDFGVAVLKEREGGLTEPGQLVGTPAFMAPEQAQGVERLTEQVDVYGLGATLVFAVTGRTVYPGVSGWPLVLRITDPARPPDLSGFPEVLAPLLAAMLAFEPADRPDPRTAGRELLRVACVGADLPERQWVVRLRQQITELTYDASAEVTISGRLADPVRDPEAVAGAADRPDQPGTGVPQPGQLPPGETSAPHRELVSAARPRPDVTRLANRLRKQYARRPEL